MSEFHHERMTSAVPMISAADEGYTGERAPHEVHPLRRLHRTLRGRYHWAVLLTLIGLAAGGVAGYKLWTPKYNTTGLIRIRPVVPTLLYKNEDSGVMPMFQQFVQSQVLLIRSQRVISKAMQDDAWKQTGRTASIEEQAAFRQSLDVRPTGGEMIQVGFTDTDLTSTQAAVEAVIRAYQQIYGERDRREEAERMRVLEERRTALNNQLASIRDRIIGIGNEYGSDALQSIYEFNLKELQKLEQSLRETELALAMAGGDAVAENVETPETPPEPSEMSIEELSQYDAELRSLLNMKKEAESHKRTLSLRFGQEHRYIRDAQASIDEVELAIQDRASQLRSAKSLDPSDTLTDVASTTMNMDQLRQRMQRLRELHKIAREQTIELGRKNLEIENLKIEQELISERLQETRNRIEELNVESIVAGRIEIVSTGDTSGMPVNEGSRKQRAVLGAAAGGSIGFGLILLLGLVDSRLKDSQDIAGPRSPARLLGVLPSLPDDMSDPEQAALAGFCVHHIRTLMQLGGDPSQRQIFAISGPSAGCGKTSLTLSLGISFACAGARTLLIDSDVVGGGLTRRLEAIIRRQIGQLLLQNGLLSHEQLEQGLAIARKRGMRLGETLVELGILEEPDLDHALSLQERATVGFLDALGGEPLDHCVAGTGVEGLEILPIGGAHSGDSGRISPRSMEGVVAQARERYDIVLIDTGPVPGSVDSAIACSQADQVVVVVSRGDHRPDADRSMDFLNSINARLAGVVFNRASVDDTTRTSFSGSLSRSSNGRDAAGAGGSNGQQAGQKTGRFGPVAQSVIRINRSESS